MSLAKPRLIRRWLAPLFGLLICTLLSAMQMLRDSGTVNPTYLVVFAALGFLAGLLLLVGDRSLIERERDLSLSPGSDPQFRTIARVLALLAILTSLFPIVGFVVGLAALASNIRRPGWPRTASVVGVVISAGMLVMLFTLPKRQPTAEYSVAPLSGRC